MYALTHSYFPNNEHRISAYKCHPPADPYKEKKEPNPPLDITSELETQCQAPAKKGLKSGYGGLPRPTKFGLNARRTLLRCGAAMDRVAGEGEIVFFTGTLPGGTDAAMEAISRWSGYMVHRLKAWVAKRVPEKLDFYCWERQRRGALHLHYAVFIPTLSARQEAIAEGKREWLRLLNEVSRLSGADLFARRKGGTWKGNDDVVQFRAEIVRKSVAAYLSKYLSKSVKGKGFSGTVQAYYPSRWWSVSRPLHALCRKMTTTNVRYYRTREECVRILDDLKACLAAVTKKVYHYVHALTQSEVVAAYESTLGPKIWNLIQWNKSMYSQSSNNGKTPAEYLSGLLKQLTLKYCLSPELIYLWCGAFSANQWREFCQSEFKNPCHAIGILNDCEYVLTFRYHVGQPKYQEAMADAALLNKCKLRLISRMAENPALRHTPLSEWS